MRAAIDVSVDHFGLEELVVEPTRRIPADQREVGAEDIGVLAVAVVVVAVQKGAAQFKVPVFANVVVPEGVKVPGRVADEVAVVKNRVIGFTHAADNFGIEFDRLVPDELRRNEIAEAHARIDQRLGAKETLDRESIINRRPCMKMKQVPPAKVEVKAAELRGQVWDAKVVKIDVCLLDADRRVDRIIGWRGFRKEERVFHVAINRENDNGIRPRIHRGTQIQLNLA